MIPLAEYQSRIQFFFNREDYDSLAGEPVGDTGEVRFGDLTYSPRKTTLLPPMMGDVVLARANGGGRGLKELPGFLRRMLAAGGKKKMKKAPGGMGKRMLSLSNLGDMASLLLNAEEEGPEGVEAGAAENLSAAGDDAAKRGTALYIHIPFCNLRCTYCGFFKNRAVDAEVIAYVDALLAEFRMLKEKGVWKHRTVTAVFFGGGTPSVLSGDQVRRIMDAVRDTGALEPDCEVTFESSIYDMDDRKFAACLDAGINRFSFGVQTFGTEERRALGRPDTREQVEERLRFFAASGARIIIDLIYGLPGQTEEMLAEDIRTGISCGIAGMDLYKLQILPNSPLAKAIAEGRTECDRSDGHLRALYLSAAALLEKEGCRRLSVCHWAVREDEESRYNTVVKNGTDLVAAGAFCGGRMGRYSYMKMPAVPRYIQLAEQGNWPVMGLRRQSCDYLLLETVNGQMDTGLLDFTLWPSEQELPWEMLLAPLFNWWTSLGLLERQGECLRLTDRGAYYSRAMNRVLLCALEYLLYGEPTAAELEQEKNMGDMMKNLR